MTAPTSENEPRRLAALREYGILDSPPEADYDDFSELAALICQCPVAIINFVDDARVWRKSNCGMPENLPPIPRDLTICSTAICSTDLLVVNDLSQDPRFSAYPRVAGAPHLRFYCGMPLINPDGHALGTLCIMDFEPRELRFEQTEAVRRLARQIMTQLELRRITTRHAEALEDLAEAQAAIEAEKATSDRLLLNILPPSIADELKRHDRVAPRFFDAATVLFADFAGFSRLAEQMEPRELVDQLDRYFSAFDDIAAAHRLEKLKTIGDAYMCAGGLPEPNRTHPVDAGLAALAMQAYMGQANTQRDKLRLPRWELRIGINTGPVMAGVVGQSKFSYDIWGDAVNVAARVEYAGEGGRTNLSEATYHHVKQFFDAEERGAIEVKTKGPVNMYYLTRLKPEFSEDDAGTIPNRQLP